MVLGEAALSLIPGNMGENWLDCAVRVAPKSANLVVSVTAMLLSEVGDAGLVEGNPESVVK